MKELRQVPGNRKWKGDDWLGMQQNLLQLTEGFYAQYGNFVLSGCVLDVDDNISAGIVLLDGKACPFAGATGASNAYHVKKVTARENVAYETGTGDGYESYTAEPCAATDAGAFRLDTAPRFEGVMKPANAGNADMVNGQVLEESGTWTPAHASIASYDNCRWQRIGNRVFINGSLALTSSAGSVSVDLDGLPKQWRQGVQDGYIGKLGRWIALYIRVENVSGEFVTVGNLFNFVVTTNDTPPTNVFLNFSYEIEP